MVEKLAEHEKIAVSAETVRLIQTRGKEGYCDANRPHCLCNNAVRWHPNAVGGTANLASEVSTSSPQSRNSPLLPLSLKFLVRHRRYAL